MPKIIVPVFIPREWKAATLVIFAMSVGFLIMPLIFAFMWDDHKLDQRLTEESVTTQGHITDLAADCSEKPCYNYHVGYEITVDGKKYSTADEFLRNYYPEDTDEEYYVGKSVDVLYLADDPSVHRIADNPPQVREDWHLVLLAGAAGILPGMVFKPKRDYAKFRYVENDLFHLRFVILPIATIAWGLLTAQHDRVVILYTLAYMLILIGLGIPWADIHRLRKRMRRIENDLRDLVFRDLSYPLYIWLFMSGLFFFHFLRQTPFQVIYVMIGFVGAWRIGSPQRIYHALMRRGR